MRTYFWVTNECKYQGFYEGGGGVVGNLFKVIEQPKKSEILKENEKNLKMCDDLSKIASIASVCTENLLFIR